MKQLHFKTRKGEFLLVEDDGNFPRDFPYELYEGIGYIDDLTDGDKWDVVEPSNGGEYFKNYEEYGYEYTTASESFDSLLKSLDVHFENHFGSEPDNFATPYTDIFTVAKRFKKYLEWQQAQSKVWKKSNTYLFKKI